MARSVCAVCAISSAALFLLTWRTKLKRGIMPYNPRHRDGSNDAEPVDGGDQQIRRRTGAHDTWGRRIEAHDWPSPSSDLSGVGREPLRGDDPNSMSLIYQALFRASILAAVSDAGARGRSASASSWTRHCRQDCARGSHYLRAAPRRSRRDKAHTNRSQTIQ